MKRGCLSAAIAFISVIAIASPVKLHCWILRQNNGAAYFTAGDVSNMVQSVNEIYSQVALTFKIESISYTNNTQLADLVYPNAVQTAAICNITNNTGGLELYFLNSLMGRATAFRRRDGIVIGPNANFRTVAHEIGHACGLSDIYNSYSETNLMVSGMPTRDRMPHDWGWYRPSMTQQDLVEKLLMYGYTSTTKADMTYGDIYGLYYTSSWNQVTRKWDKHWFLGLAPVGFGEHGNRNPTSQ